MVKKPENSVDAGPKLTQPASAGQEEIPVEVPGQFDIGFTVSARQSGARSMNGGEQMSAVNRLFSSKERTFWMFQVVGWTGYALLRTFQAITSGQELYYYSWFVGVATLVGFGMTTLMRHLYRLVRGWPLQWLLLCVMLVCSGLGLLFSSIETFLAPFLLPGLEPYQGIQRFGNAMFESTALFAWSAIYFGYHYYRGFQEQQEQVLKATAMAHQAQLKMLRYQLNPHFLFNTLNAISTLVLEKAETEANQMLTKLSSFLRFTLVNQPTQRISLDQELYALGLYLDIENVRFGERLIVNFDIDERARTALIPSLLLQPLIENAIKYAIAPAIDGGAISVCATAEDGRLKIALKDDGPGIADLSHIVSQSGSGVGLVNTKERLLQIYGADHSFTLKNLSPQGLGIFIEIPCDKVKHP